MNHNFNKFSELNDDEWIDILIQSIKEPLIDGIQFAGFPDSEIQALIVGSSNEQALREAGNFYKYVKNQYHDINGKRLTNSKILDFGIGWGRIARFFARDVPYGDIHGVDTIPLMVDLCRRTMVPATTALTLPHGETQYRNGFFDIVYAYSVFTHLPEHMCVHWLNELYRITKPGALIVMTVEPPRFIDFCRSIVRGSEPSVWHQYLKMKIDEMPDAEARVENGQLVYIPTGGGPDLPPDVYGDTIIPRDYIAKNWEKQYKIIDYLDDPNKFWQAVVVLTRK